MFFIFPLSARYGFWMKDMNFPIDIIWIDGSYRKVETTTNITPDTYPTTFHPYLPAKYVLEVNAGFVRKQNIYVGDRIILKK